MQATLATLSTNSTVDNATPNATSKAMRWIGRVVTAVPVLFLLLDGAIKLPNIQPVVDASIELGLPLELAPWLGAILLTCLAIYLVPRTAVLGAILLTGYLGGAIAIHARNQSELFSLVFPIMLGAPLWIGLVLRDREVRTLLLRR